MNAPKEASKVMTTAIHSLSGNPLCISLLVLVGIIVGFGYLKTVSAIEGRTQAILALIDKCNIGGNQ